MMKDLNAMAPFLVFIGPVLIVFSANLGLLGIIGAACLGLGLAKALVYLEILARKSSRK